MRLNRILILTMLTNLFFQACNAPPNRPNFKTVNGKDQNPQDPNDPTDPDDPTEPAGPDLNITRDTLGKILAESGSAQDAECSAKPLNSKNQLRLLTTDEYQNTVGDILQVTTDYRSLLPIDTAIFGFRNNADVAVVTDSHADKYLNVSIAVADEVKAKLQTLVQCNESEGASCIQKVIDTLGPKLWRRPLEVAEKTSIITLSKVGLASSPREGMSLAITSLLMSPNFLYRSEIGKSGTLTSYELASALSYFFWGSVPDATLSALAASGELSKDSILEAQATRLLASPRSKYATIEFANAWLESKKVRGSSKDPAKFPALTQDIQIAMAAEAENTFDFLVKQPNSNFESLFTSDFTIGDEKLAQYYKGQAANNGTVTKITFPGTPRKGVLGFGAVLAHLATASETHPIRRGDFVLKNMFCDIPLPTPEGLDVKVPDFSPNMTTRERFAKHTASPACASCHLAIDGIGLGMEDFDGGAIYRDMDNGKAVDVAGELVKIDGGSTKFDGVGGLSAYTATSKQAKRCYVVEWFRLAHGYTERPADICAIRDVANKFEKGTMTLSQLIISIITHQSYAKKEQ